MSRVTTSACNAALVRTLGAGRDVFGLGVKRRGIGTSSFFRKVFGGRASVISGVPKAGEDALLAISSSSSPNESSPLRAFFFLFFGGCPRGSLPGVKALNFAN